MSSKKGPKTPGGVNSPRPATPGGRTPGKPAGSPAVKADSNTSLSARYVFDDMLECVDGAVGRVGATDLITAAPSILSAFGLLPNDEVCVIPLDKLLHISHSKAPSTAVTPLPRTRSALATPAEDVLGELSGKLDALSITNADTTDTTTGDSVDNEIVPLWRGRIWPYKKQEAGSITIPGLRLFTSSSIATATTSSLEGAMTVSATISSTQSASKVGAGMAADGSGDEIPGVRIMKVDGKTPFQPAKTVKICVNNIETIEKSVSLLYNARIVAHQLQKMAGCASVVGPPTADARSILAHLVSSLITFMSANGAFMLIGCCISAAQSRIFKLAEVELSLEAEESASGIAVVDRETRFINGHQIMQTTRESISTQSFGGYKEVMESLQALIYSSLVDTRKYTDVGLSPPRGALLVGPPGTGKTMLARVLAASLNISFFVINGPEFMSNIIGATESKLLQVFEAAKKAEPSIIFIDEIDGLCPRRDDAAAAEARVVSTLLALLDGVDSEHASATGASAGIGRVFLLGATNRVTSLDPALRRPGRFDKEIEMPVPNEMQRLDILHTCMRAYPNELSESSLKDIAARTFGYVGADLAAVCREAARQCLRRAAKEGSLETSSTPRVIDADMVVGMRKVQPSAIREIQVEVPSVRWSDIGGQEDVKARLREAVEWPLSHPEVFKRMGIRPPKGVLLFGPPGCSKTMMAKAMATESHMNFIAVKGPELFSKYVGDSEKAVAETFHKARTAAPCIIFFDEFDAMAGSRAAGDDAGGGSSVGTRVVSQLLTELDGVNELKQVVIVAATNRPDLIDRALLRPGRVDRLLYVGPPDAPAREAIVRMQLAKVPHSASIDVAALVEALDGYSGAEIVGIFREAAVRAVNDVDELPELKHAHITQAISTMPKQITPEMLAFYSTFLK